MVSRKASAIEQSAKEAGQAAQRASTPQVLTRDRKPQAGELTSLRIDPVDKALMKETFAQCGVTFAGGLKIAGLYIAQELKAGRMSMSKAGLFQNERRG
jgi:hypothetical protein